jgi:hypothetical protein
VTKLSQDNRGALRSILLVQVRAPDRGRFVAGFLDLGF